MAMLKEGELELHYPDEINIYKIEDDTPSHCMNAVDFILNLDNEIFFLEIKDYRNYKGTDKELKEELTTYRKDKSYAYKNNKNKSFIYELVHKCRDSFIYEYSLDRVQKDKEIIYIVFILFPIQLDNKNTMWLSRNINNHLATYIPKFENPPHKKPFIKDKLVLIDTNSFNERFERKYNIHIHLTN